MVERSGNQPANRSAWVTLARYSGLAMLLPCAALVGYGLGWWLDHHFHTGTIFTILGAIAGAGAGLFELIRETWNE
jgi:F0F1-type ATP synthase assembly protein I